MADIRTVDTRKEPIGPLLDQLRHSLGLQGDIVSEAGRRKTLEVFGEALTPQAVVERICRDVRQRGVDAVCEYSQKLDRAACSAEDLRVPESELARAHASASPEFRATLQRITDRIYEFQRAILHQPVTVQRPHGVQLQQRYQPLRRVGICVPGGAAAYPSTVLMTAVPALAAGVSELAVVAPPTPYGAFNDDLLATCHHVGIREVYRVGGAQGIAALAYGVPGVPRVDKIVGPGNLFVALAKKYVYGEVDIDSIAGPSEVVILADDTARPAYLAADMLAQAEHSPGASILLTWSDAILREVQQELDRQLSRLSREDLTRTSLADYGALIRTRSVQEAVEISNAIGPEHLQVCVTEPHALLPELRNAGAIFLGHNTPVAVGDYAAGPSHVLPTGGTARWASGLSANHFLRSYSVLEFPRDGLAEIAPDVRLLADKEGLTAHRASIDIRNV